MHGSPRSKYDNKDVWKKYDYKKYEIKIEPYFDIDFNQMFISPILEGVGTDSSIVSEIRSSQIKYGLYIVIPIKLLEPFMKILFLQMQCLIFIHKDGLMINHFGLLSYLSKALRI
jgi:hypothetical protein